MLRALRILLLALLGVVLLTVAIANRQLVPIKALPDDLAAFGGVSYAVELPLFLIIFAAIIVGVFIGFVWEWMREHRIRSEASSKSRQVAKLERELAVMRDTKPAKGSDAELLALIDRRKS